MASQNIGRQKLGHVVAWMTGALISFSVSALAIRALGKQLTIFEIVEKPYYMEQIVTAVRRLLGHAVPQDRSA